MKIDVYTTDNDNVINSIVATGRLNYQAAIANLLPLINRFSHQRKIQTPDFYKRLSDDILDGCIMPPITIAFIIDEVENLTFTTESVKEYVISNIDKGYILDGIQRLNTLSNISNHERFDPNKFLYLNIILSSNKDMLLYRMITLNNGQKPMSPRHQIEVLTKELFNFEELNIDVQTEKERAENIVRGAFNLADISKGYMAYITGSVNNENNKIISEKMDEIIIRNIFNNAKSSDYDFTQVLEKIDTLCQNDSSKRWLKTQNNLIGFCVGVRSSLSKLNSISPQEFGDFSDKFEKAFKAINPSKVNLGRYRRELAAKVIEQLDKFINKSDSELTEYFVNETSN